MLFLLLMLVLPLVAAKDIIYITKTTNGDSVLRDLITEKGYTFDVVNINNIGGVDFSDYEMILVGNEDFTSSQAAKIPINAKNSVVLDKSDLAEWGWSTSAASSISPSNPRTLPVWTKGSSIVTGLGDEVQSYVNNGFGVGEYTFYYISNIKKPAGMKTIVADDLSFRILTQTYVVKNGAVVGTITPGVVLKNGQTSQARGLFFGITNTDLWTSDTKKLFRNSLYWAMRKAPVLSDDVPNQTWNEDEEFEIDLDSYFSDPAGGSLTYSISETSEDKNITLNFLPGGKVEFSTVENWYGSDWVILKATNSDGLFAVSNKVSLKVNPVNDAPVLDDFLPISVIEGQLVEITAVATDPEGDAITYSASDARFQKNDNVFTWQTQIGDAGTYTINITTKDSKQATSTKAAVVEVFPKALINEFVSNPLEGNDFVEFYNLGNKALDLSVCLLKDGASNELALGGSLPAGGFMAFEWSNRLNNDGDTIELYCDGQLTDKVSYGNWDDGNIIDNAVVPGKGESSGRDPDGKDTNVDVDDFKIFENPTKNLPNNADVVPPVVNLISPENLAFFGDTRDVEFTFVATDDRAEKLTCSIYINDLQIMSSAFDNGLVGSFLIDGFPDGTYKWNVKCADSLNSAFSPEDRTFDISAPDFPVLNSIGSKSGSENETLTFDISATDVDSDLSLLTFKAENLPKGASFIDNFNGKGTFLWLPGFQQSGDYEVKFIVEDPEGLEDSETVKITVKNVKEPPKFSDIDLCEEINSDLEITIKNPDEDDEFMIGDTIKGEVKISNRAEEDLDTDLEFYLYDATEEDAVVKQKDSVDVDKKESETVEFELTVPEDANENNDYYVFVKSEAEEGVSYCNQKKIQIQILREEHNVVIKEISFNPQKANQGEYTDVEVKLENLGEEDETAYVKLENKELNLFEKSESFEIENYWEDKEKTVTLSIKVPENAIEKDYEILATVFFEDGVKSNSTPGKLTVTKTEGKLPSFLPLINLGALTGTETAGNGKAPISLTSDSVKPGNNNGNSRKLPTIPLGKETGKEGNGEETEDEISQENIQPKENFLYTKNSLISTIAALLIGIILVLFVMILIISRRRRAALLRRNAEELREKNDAELAAEATETKKEKIKKGKVKGKKKA